MSDDIIKPLFFCCELCNYSTYRKSSYHKHLNTNKHKTFIEMQQINKKFQCDKCSKYFISRSGLWKHGKQCILDKQLIKYMDNDAIIALIQDNAEIKKILTQVLQNGVTTNYNLTNNVNNSNNKSFNLNVFLNETCKDAMNISDFVSSIKVDLNDLELTGEKGYVEEIGRAHV